MKRSTRWLCMLMGVLFFGLLFIWITKRSTKQDMDTQQSLLLMASPPPAPMTQSTAPPTYILIEETKMGLENACNQGKIMVAPSNNRNVPHTLQLEYNFGPSMDFFWVEHYAIQGQPGLFLRFLTFDKTGVLTAIPSKDCMQVDISPICGAGTFEGELWQRIAVPNSNLLFVLRLYDTPLFLTRIGNNLLAQGKQANDVIQPCQKWYLRS